MTCTVICVSWLETHPVRSPNCSGVDGLRGGLVLSTSRSLGRRPSEHSVVSIIARCVSLCGPSTAIGCGALKDTVRAVEGRGGSHMGSLASDVFTSRWV